MVRGTKVQVSATHQHHPNRIGYFAFDGTGASEGTVVLTDKPNSYPQVMFAVGQDDFKVLENSQ